MLNPYKDSFPLAQDSTLQEYLVKQAVDRFNLLDKYLLDVQISEICMCGRVAFYMQDWLWQHDIFDYDVDLEYNRGYDGLEINTKKLDGKDVRLDLIVHKRGYDESGEGFTNIICIEMKKASNWEGCEDDEVRLEKLTDPRWGFCYRLGVMLYANDMGKKRALRIKAVFRDGGQVNMTETLQGLS